MQRAVITLDNVYIVVCSHSRKKDIKLTERKMYKLEIHPTFRRIISVFYEFGFWENEKVATENCFIRSI